MAKGLDDFMKECSSKKDLCRALLPRSRIVHVNMHHEDIGGTIQSILSLIKNSIEQHQQTVDILLPSKGKTPVSLKFPEYGLYSAAAAQPPKRVTILLNLLQTIQEALYTGEVKTIRDVYYANVELYGKQDKVNKWVTTIARCFELKSKISLNVIPAQKGLCFTTHDIKICTKDRIDRIPPLSSTLIPHMDERSTCEVSGSHLRLLVVEKEAIYNKLTNAANGKLPRDCIVVTGKGYPDFLTRLFLNKLQCISAIERWDIYTDADPHGMEIASTYLFNENEHYTCGKLVHRGVFLSQLMQQRQRQVQFLPLTKRDTALASRLLQRATELGSTQPRLLIELQRQIFLQKKAEMNFVEKDKYMASATDTSET